MQIIWKNWNVESEYFACDVPGDEDGTINLAQATWIAYENSDLMRITLHSLMNFSSDVDLDFDRFDGESKEDCFLRVISESWEITEQTLNIALNEPGDLSLENGVYIITSDDIQEMELEAMRQDEQDERLELGCICPVFLVNGRSYTPRIEIGDDPACPYCHFKGIQLH
jgi:hypothetical protein